MTHSGDARLARHVGNATVRTDNRGTRVYKEHKHSSRRIDLAVCAIMAHSMAATVDPGVQLYLYDAESSAAAKCCTLITVRIGPTDARISRAVPLSGGERDRYYYPG